MLKLPPLDTLLGAYARGAPPYAAVNRVRGLAATPGVSLEEITAARRAVNVAAAELTRLVDAARLFQTKRATAPYFGRA